MDFFFRAANLMLGILQGEMKVQDLPSFIEPKL